jgi:hypothetical protein
MPDQTSAVGSAQKERFTELLLRVISDSVVAINQRVSSRTDRTWTVVAALVAMFLIQYALGTSDGALQPEALVQVILALCTLVFALVTRKGSWNLPTKNVLNVVGFGMLCFQLGMFVFLTPTSSIPYDVTLPFRIGVLVVAGMVAVTGISTNERYSALPLVGVIVTYFLLGVWVLRSSPSPFIDLVTVHQEALEALLHGKSPFAVTFENIYRGNHFYGDGLTKGNRVLFGYGYPPLSLLMAVPGHVLVGDYRYSLLVANCVSGWLIGRIAGGQSGVMLSALFLFTSRGYYTLDMGWTEAWVMLGASLVAWCELRHQKYVPLVLGLFLSTKQNCVMFAPLALMLPSVRVSTRTLLRTAIITFGVMVAINLPFVLWDAKSFYWSAIESHRRLYFRDDSLNAAAWLVQHGYRVPFKPLTAGMIALSLALVFRRAAYTASGFLFGCALTNLASMMFYRAAFCNYYWLLIGLLTLSIATHTDVVTERVPLARGISEEIGSLEGAYAEQTLWARRIYRQIANILDGIANWFTSNGVALLKSLGVFYLFLSALGVYFYLHSPTPSRPWTPATPARKTNPAPLLFKNHASVYNGAIVRAGAWDVEAIHHPMYLIDEEAKPSEQEMWSTNEARNAWVEIRWRERKHIHETVIDYASIPAFSGVPQRYLIECIDGSRSTFQLHVTQNNDAQATHPLDCDATGIRLRFAMDNPLHRIAIYEIQAWGEP